MAKNTIGIRLEDKNRWERRVALIPEHVKELIVKEKANFIVQPSPIRIFRDEEYVEAGAILSSNLEQASVIVAVKEIPVSALLKDRTYIFFSHTIKGQKYNMPMLKRLMELRANLIDYERIVDDRGRRLIFFGRYAGLAGMIDTFWSLGQLYLARGIDSPFSLVKQTWRYESLEDAKKAILEIKAHLREKGNFPSLVIGFAGYGNVSSGAQEIYDLLEPETISPETLLSSEIPPAGKLYKVVFREEHTVRPKKKNISSFELSDYFEHPENYESAFDRYIPFLDILVNGIFWTPRNPRLVTREYLKKLFSEKNKKPRLSVIGDIGCDIEGAIECTVKATTPDNPSFTYYPLDGSVIDGIKDGGIVVMAVDNLPCELPREASTEFSKVLVKFMPEIISNDFSLPFEKWTLSPPLKRATILAHGRFTPDYTFMERFLE